MKIKNRKGQVLLIIVMLVATVITVVMTIAFNSTTETQIARLETDSQKALAAADAGIDAVIKNSINTTPFNIATIQQFSDQKITGSAQVLGVVKSNFITPLLQKDESYTLYLSDYTSSPPSFANPWSGDIYLYLVSESGCPSIEITVINNDFSIQKYTYNTCPLNRIISNAILASPTSTTIESISFAYKTGLISIVSGRVAVIKVLGGRTKIGVQGYDVDGITAKTLPIQGKTVESEARTASGVVKKVQLFQSFPQIPSNFFMTSF